MPGRIKHNYSTENIKHNFKEGREEIKNVYQYDIYIYIYMIYFDTLKAYASFFK